MEERKFLLRKIIGGALAHPATPRSLLEILGEREGKQNLPSKIRKSAFPVFKKEYLSSQTGTVHIFNLSNIVQCICNYLVCINEYVS